MKTTGTRSTESPLQPSDRHPLGRTAGASGCYRFCETLFRGGYAVAAALTGLVTAASGAFLLVAHLVIGLGEERRIVLRWHGVGFLALLFVLIGTLVAVWWLGKWVRPALTAAALTLLYAAGVAGLVVGLSHELRADQLFVVEAARALTGGDYSSLREGYLAVYPYQLGLATYERVVLAVWDHVAALFVVNAVLVAVSHLLMWRIVHAQPWATRCHENLVLVACFAFLPAFFTIPFIYGTLPGLCAVIGALYFLDRLLRRRGSAVLATVGAALAIAAAVIVRSNFSIALLALLIVVVGAAIASCRWRLLLSALALVGVVVGAKVALASGYEQASGQSIPEGMPTILWVNMGLSEPTGPDNFPGWYDGSSLAVFERAGHDSAAAAEEGARLVRARVGDLAADPAHAAWLFTKKAASTWGEPTLMSVWSGPKGESASPTGDPVLGSLYRDGRVYDLFSVLCAGLVALIYLGALVGTVAPWARRGDSQELWDVSAAIVLIIAGGFLFHLVWETQSQYVYPYVYLAIVLTVRGAGVVASALAELRDHRQGRRPVESGREAV